MTVDGHVYCCVEQYMMAEKARLFKDNETWTRIMNSTNPSDQKSLGRSVRGYVERTWSDTRYDIVLRGTVEKYRQNNELRELLLSCDRDAEFVEASPYDGVWGIRMSKADPGIEDPKNWKGLNLLGHAITEARGIILAEFP